MKLPSTAFLRDNAPWLATGAILTFSSSYGQTFFISVFAGQIMAAFALSDGAWGAIYSAGTLISAGLVAVAGSVTDHFRVRVLAAVILSGLALACLSMAAASAAWMLVPVIFLLRFTGQGMTGHLANVAMARWFSANRGKALATAVLGVAVGESLLPVTFVALMEAVPWRALWVAAGVMALIPIPILFAILRQERTPQSMGEEDHTPGMSDRHWTRADALRHPLFLSAIPLLIGPAAFVTSLFFQQVHLSGQKGWTHVEFVALFPLYTAMTVTGMIGSGFLIDRFGTARLMQLFQLPLIAGFVLMGFASDLWLAALSIMLVALSHGINVTLPTAFLADYFGTRHLGAIRSLVQAITVFGTALGPLLTGLLIDLGIPFDTQMPVIALYFVATSVLIAAALTTAGPLSRYARS